MKNRLNKFLIPTVTFTIENVGATILNKLSKFNIKNVKFNDDILSFDVSLLYRKKIERLIANQTFKVNAYGNAMNIIGFFYSNLAFVGCLVVMIVALFIFDGLVFRVRVEGLLHEEREQVIGFLHDNGVRNLTWKRRHTQDIAIRLSQEFEFIAHSNMVLRGSTLIFNVYRAVIPPGASKTDIKSNHDAVITSMMIMSGIPKVKIGDIVNVGQVLVEAAFQIGVEVGEPDEFGQNTYTPITHPGVAIAEIFGEVSFSMSRVVSNTSEADTNANEIYLELLLEHGFDDGDIRQVFIQSLPDGGYSVEVVIRRIIKLH